MAIPFVASLPLRVPVPQNDMAGMMAAWMDKSPGMGLSSAGCRSDLEAIDRLRRDIAQRLGERPSGNGNGTGISGGIRVEEISKESQAEIVEKLHEYYHYLLECEKHGMVQTVNGGSGESKYESSSSTSECVSLEWESAVLTTGPFRIQIAHGLESERANVIWNLAALEAHKASTETLTTKIGWNRASKDLQNAASWLGQLLALLNTNDNYKHCSDMSTTFVLYWQAILLAQAQHCIYESLSCVKRPMQLLSAKLAAAAVPLYGAVELIAQNDENANANTNSNSNSNSNSTAAEDNPENLPILPQLENVPNWAHFSRAWGAYMSCKAAYHQSQIHREKRAWGQELARLDVAYQHAAICKSLCDEESPQSGARNQSQSQPHLLEELRATVDETLGHLKSLVESAERENTNTHKHAVPTQQELAEIRGQNLVKCNEPLSKLLRPKTTEPIFQQKHNTSAPAAATGTATDDPTAFATPSMNTEASIMHSGNNHFNQAAEVVETIHKKKNTLRMSPESKTISPAPPSPSPGSSPFVNPKKKAFRSNDNSQSNSNSDNATILSPNLATYAEIFRAEMSEIISELARATEDQTESARLALAEVHLPHSLTAYQQEQSGGGLPEALWQKVEVVQEDHKLVRLKQDLWELKDAADLARATHETVVKQLEFDRNSDQEFRASNPNFEGHDVLGVQGSFRKPLANYDALLSSAQEGDAVLFRRLKQLDIEPKYNLLQFSKSQLDRLLPGSRTKTNDSVDIDTQHLRFLLGELSALFQERANLMDTIRAEFRNFDIIGALAERIESKSKSARGTGTIAASDKEYFEATRHAQKAFDATRQEIGTNMTRQDELLATILSENEAFSNSRERTTNSQSADSCIVMIEDAIEEIDQLSKHLKEGKGFYNVVIPKLDELKHKAEDVSARLTVERLEYGERELRATQERKDALMAQTLERSGSSAQPTKSAASVSAPVSASVSASASNSDSNSNSSSSAPASASPAATTNSSSSSNNTRDASDAEAPSQSESQSLLPSSHSQSQSLPPSHSNNEQSSNNSGVAAASRETRTVSHISHQNRTACRIDDEKVATFVAMDFDADKVVAALEKHDNNMDLALNELLSG